VGGGTPPYAYQWSNGATTEDVSNLAQGIYSVTVTDDHGCTISRMDTIIQSVINTNVIGFAPSCNGGNDGQANLTVTGGFPPFTYQWSNGETTEDAVSLSPGQHSVTVTDHSGCQAIATVTIPNTSAQFTLTATVTDVSCPGNLDGEIAISGTGFSPPVSYQWSTGDTTSSISGLAEGTYTVTVTDQDGCAVMDATVGAPPPISLNGQVSDASCPTCADGEIHVAASGGTPPYSYIWSNGGSTATISGLNPGTYSVTVLDDNVCAATATATVGVGCYPPDSMLVTNIQPTKAKLNWTMVSTGFGYVVRIRKVGTSNWTYLVFGSKLITSKSLNNLPANRFLEWQIATICDSNQTSISTYSDKDTFFTECSTPENLRAQNITATSVTLRWDPVPGALAYLIRGRKLGGPIVEKLVGGPQKTFNNLKAGTSYEWRVKAFCDSASYGPSNFSVKDTFSTPSASPKYQAGADGLTTGHDEPMRMDIYPNPNEGRFHILLNNGGRERVRIEIFDVNGRNIRTFEVNAPGSEHLQPVDLSKLPKGVYNIRAHSGSQQLDQQVMVQ